MTLKEMRQMRICGEQTFKCQVERDEHMLHYEQGFDNVFYRREIKCVILIKNCRKVKGEQVITL